jgi:single-strand DNA-binding protein
MVNKVILIGRLGRDPELRYTQGGQPVANFSLATNERWTSKDGEKQERTEWHRIVVWGKTAETCSEYLSKGRQIYVEGRLQTREWEDKEGNKRSTTEVNANTVQFLGARGDTGGGDSSYGGPPSGGDEPSGPSDPPPGGAGGAGGDDDIPF